MNNHPAEQFLATEAEDGLERDARRLRNGSLIGAAILEGVALMEPALAVPLTAVAVTIVLVLGAGGSEYLRWAARHRRLRNARL